MTELHDLRDTYRLQKNTLLAALQATGSSTRGIHALLRKFSRLADGLLCTLWQRAALPPTLALVAVGGFGREQLFPYSDVDVLVLLPDNLANADTVRGQVAEFIRNCWDAGLEIGSSVRTVQECPFAETMLAEVSAPLRHCRSTVNPPRARIPRTLPSRHACGSAGSRCSSPP